MVTLANLSKEVDRTFSIDEIAKKAAKLFQLEYNDDLTISLTTFLANTVRSGDHDIVGDFYHGNYALSIAGQQFQAACVAASSPTTKSTTTSSSSARNNAVQAAARGAGMADKPSSSSSNSQTGKRGREQQSSSSSSSSSSSQPSDKRPRHNDEAIAASGKGATSKKSASSTGNHGGGSPAVPVEQYSLLSGKTIKKFDSLTKASIATGFGRGGIAACIDGKRPSFREYGWRNASISTTTATTTTNAATDIRSRSVRDVNVPIRYQKTDPYNLSFSKGAILSSLILSLVISFSFYFLTHQT